MNRAFPDMVFLDAKTIGDVNEMEMLKGLGKLTVYPETTPEDRIKRIAGNQIVITNKVVIDREVIDSCPHLKLVCIAATGTNNVDLEYARERGIIVRNVAGYSTESVVQHTMALLLSLCNRIEYYSSYVRSRKYSESHIFTHYGPAFNELNGKILGIIGLGAIGRRVAETATTLGMSVIYYSTTGKNLHAGYKSVSLEKLLKDADVVSVHCPLNENTRGLIDRTRLVMMKRSAVLINTGRGGVVNERDLAFAIDNGIIAGAALDVMEKEPPDADNPLLSLEFPERLIITPHIAWATIEARSRLVIGIVDNIRDYLNISM